ncbi:MAG: ABC-F family ATP-binding cassette domain-containing protein, partial [Alphaproteobacteria bacterium]|nr:ABC-F family ATP-binding cassette domain-containing protein [Alphaproteobacteria bacterium]
MLEIKDLTYRIGGRAIFEGATATVPTGAHAGLVGRNGAGKTTLLRLVQGEIQPDAGRIVVPRRTRIGALAQEAPAGSLPVIATVLAADRERDALLAEAERSTDPDRIAAVHSRLGEIEAHAAPARAAEILAGLGLSPSEIAGPCDALSGGWRMRVALAAVLFARPDLLLLDEPTNHLDLEARLWLENFLGRYRGTVILVSHDRDLLDATTDRTLHLAQGRLAVYGGGYSSFERVRREQRETESRANANLLAQRRKMMAFVERFRAKATKARQAQSRLKALERMPPILPIVEEATIGFDFPDPEPLAPPIVALDGVAVGYEPDRPVLRRLDLRIDMDDRIALLGQNGNGKSTLVKLLAGRLDPLAGRMTRGARLRVGYCAQHQIEDLDPGATGYEHLMRLEPGGQEPRLRAHLGRFGFAQEKADVPAAQLSGGEKVRLLFALMSRTSPHLMLLDEPTNHLDIEAREALVQALAAYDGAVVLVTHDPHLITLAAERLWIVADGTCAPYDGDLDDYRSRVLEGRRAARAEAAAKTTEPARRDQRRAAAEARA